LSSDSTGRVHGTRELDRHHRRLGELIRAPDRERARALLFSLALPLVRRLALVLEQAHLIRAQILDPPNPPRKRQQPVLDGRAADVVQPQRAGPA
jgi:hypothetical protein